MRPEDSIRHNIRAHEAVADRYEVLHGEIFNPIEQARLRGHLSQAVGSIRTPSTPKVALDFGCGSGNLTRHLIELGLSVAAADVTPRLLALARERFGGTGRLAGTVELNGRDLSNVESDRFDLVVTYSVLHHVPDYLRIVEEMVRVVRPGGVVYIDHEVNPSYWQVNPEYERFRREALGLRRFAKYLAVSGYVTRLRRMFDPRYSPEGDVHVWPDDHVEWDRVEQVLSAGACEVLLREDYLLYRRGYRREVYERCKVRCPDMRVLIARKA